MRYKVFGSYTGLRVSELVLGTSNFGTGWGHGTTREEARRIFDTYAEAGGNFIDTANGYQFGDSEEIVGDLLKGRRDEFVLATKFSVQTTNDSGLLVTGNSRFAMVSSVEASLKRLKTDRIDMYWLHVADGVTPTEEILRGFDDLARAGKILYAGLSDTPAWRVARAVTMAELNRTLPIAGLQFEHSLVARTAEHEMVPAGRGLGLGMVAFSPLGGGMLTGKYRRGEKGRFEGLNGAAFHPENSPQRTAILDALFAMAELRAVTPGEIAIAWVASKGILPIIGPRTLVQLKSNLGATAVTLTADDVSQLDRLSAVEPIFPNTVLDDPRIQHLYTAGRADLIDLPVHTVA